MAGETLTNSQQEEHERQAISEALRTGAADHDYQSVESFIKEQPEIATIYAESALGRFEHLIEPVDKV
jgi:hypothetical protein